MIKLYEGFSYLYLILTENPLKVIADYIKNFSLNFISLKAGGFFKSKLKSSEWEIMPTFLDF